jgi:predicted nuclease of restriction endonuclease-like (RecB) superfamily
LIEANFYIGKLIITEEQSGKQRAEYGANIIYNLSEKLTVKYGRGYSVDSLERMRKFYILYKEFEGDLRKLKLTWSHYLFLIKIKDSSIRKFYEYESIAENWKLEELKRQFNSGLYERLALGKSSVEIKELAEIGQVINAPIDIVKNNYILEFTAKDLVDSYSESDLESAIINNLERFILELGKGFSFVGRQVRIGANEEALRIDLVFYNRLLKSHFLIDLKIGELKHADIGQMLVYKKYYDTEVKQDWENKTVGLILAFQRDDFVVKYMPDDEYLFTSEYQLYLPSKEELQILQNKINEQLSNLDENINNEKD